MHANQTQKLETGIDWRQKVFARCAFTDSTGLAADVWGDHGLKATYR
jgi:hypothetical protein